MLEFFAAGRQVVDNTRSGRDPDTAKIIERDGIVESHVFINGINE